LKSENGRVADIGLSVFFFKKKKKIKDIQTYLLKNMTSLKIKCPLNLVISPLQANKDAVV